MYLQQSKLNTKNVTNFTLVTRKWENENLTIELVTLNEIKYFSTSS